MQFLHISSPPEQPTTDKLQKIRPVLDRVVSNFMAAYIPTKDLSVDGSIISFKGRLSWVQYMPKKPHKWGLKAWVLADSTNGYAWNWQLYTGNLLEEVATRLSQRSRSTTTKDANRITETQS